MASSTNRRRIVFDGAADASAILSAVLKPIGLKLDHSVIDQNAARSDWVALRCNLGVARADPSTADDVSREHVALRVHRETRSRVGRERTIVDVAASRRGSNSSDADAKWALLDVVLRLVRRFIMEWYRPSTGDLSPSTTSTSESLPPVPLSETAAGPGLPTTLPSSDHLIDSLVLCGICCAPGPGLTDDDRVDATKLPLPVAVPVGNFRQRLAEHPTTRMRVCAHGAAHFVSPKDVLLASEVSNDWSVVEMTVSEKIYQLSTYFCFPSPGRHSPSAIEWDIRKISYARQIAADLRY